MGGTFKEGCSLMKISFITSTLHAGGSERVMALLANSFADKGYEVEIICLNQHLQFYELHEQVKAIHVEDHVGKRVLKKVTWLRRHVRKEQPDVVIAFMLEVFCLTLFALIGIKVPVISSERIDPHFFGRAKGFLRWLLLRRTTHLVVQTEQIKSFYSSRLQQRTTIIPNPVTDSVFNIQPGEKKNRLIAVGRLAYQKNYPMMFRCFKKLLNSFPDYQLFVYGDGPQKEEIKQFILSENLEHNIILAGRTENIIDELNVSKAFLMTSDYEGMSNAMLEALCVGLPIVTTEVSGARDLIESGINGFITPARDESAYVDALVDLLSNDHLMNVMAQNNRKKAEVFRKEKIVEQWNKLIHQIVFK